MRVDRAVAEHQFDRERSALGVLEQRQFALADLESHPRGIERHDRSQRLRRGFRHQPADLQQAVADTSADRRADRRVLEIQFRRAQDRAICLHGRFAGLHGRLARLASGDRVVEVLPRRRFFVHEGFEACDVLSGLQ